jgi:hypothetical protein
MISLWRTALTSRDNQSGDIGRISLALLLTTYCCLEIYSVVWLKQPFSEMQFATAGAALVAGCSAGLRLKASTEPGS